MQYQFEHFVLDTLTFRLLINGQQVVVEPRIIELLALLLAAYPAHCEPQFLLRQLWPKTVVTKWSLARLVSDSRKVFREFGFSGPLIQTLHGKGYRLAPELADVLQRLPEESRFSSLPAAVNKTPYSVWAMVLTATLACLVLSAFWLFPTDERIENTGPPLLLNEPADTLARILWVDDHPQNNQTERNWLKQRKVAVYTATNTHDALLLLSMYRYDAIISDMGRNDNALAGLYLLQALRQRNDQTAFLLYTLMSSEQQQQIIWQNGGQGVAVTSAELYSLLETILPLDN